MSGREIHLRLRFRSWSRRGQSADRAAHLPHLSASGDQCGARPHPHLLGGDRGRAGAHGTYDWADCPPRPPDRELAATKRPTLISSLPALGAGRPCAWDDRGAQRCRANWTKCDTFVRLKRGFPSAINARRSPLGFAIALAGGFRAGYHWKSRWEDAAAAMPADCWINPRSTRAGDRHRRRSAGCSSASARPRPRRLVSGGCRKHWGGWEANHPGRAGDHMRRRARCPRFEPTPT